MPAVPDEIGRFFIVSFPESAPDDETLYFIQDNRIGGVILFAGHCRNQDNLKSWLGEFKKSIGYNIIVAVDQEGGRVRRFMRRFPILEAPRYYGESGKLKRYKSDLSRVCEKLREIGINMNFSPTVDLFDAGEGHVLDSRTFSDDPEVVSKFARATIEIHGEHGLLTCCKHFPGLGRSRGDPHTVLAESDLSEEDFFELELKPFSDIIEFGVDSVMVTHLSVPNVDRNPAIVSRKIISGWLKEKLGFSGPVITDDLLMEGACTILPLPQLSVRSFKAGADLLLFGQDLKKTREALDRFGEYWHSSGFNRLRIDDSRKRINTLTAGIRA
jgi:beta-N-acetylhexosaminidase